jgi:hypothetical protein
MGGTTIMTKALLVTPIIVILLVAVPSAIAQASTTNGITLLFCNWQHVSGIFHNRYLIWWKVANVGNSAGSENGTLVQITISGPNDIPILTDYASAKPHSFPTGGVA